MKPNLRLRAAILQVVENQIKNNNPPETKETLMKLMRAGDTQKEAIRKIAVVLTEEVYNMLKNNETFNQKRFVNRLKKLC